MCGALASALFTAVFTWTHRYFTHLQNKASNKTSNKTKNKKRTLLVDSMPDDAVSFLRLHSEHLSFMPGIVACSLNARLLPPSWHGSFSIVIYWTSPWPVWPLATKMTSVLHDHLWLWSNSCTHPLLVSCGSRGQVLWHLQRVQLSLKKCSKNLWHLQGTVAHGQWRVQGQSGLHERPCLKKPKTQPTPAGIAGEGMALEL